MELAIIIILGILFLLFILFTILSLYLIFTSFVRTSNARDNFLGYVSHLRKKGREDEANLMAEGLIQLEDMPTEDVWITSYDGLKLHGVLLPSKTGENKTAILVHGYRNEWKYEFAAIWSYYYQNGWRILFIEHRSHGKSEGKYITFGVRERFDLCGWVNEMKMKFGEDNRIVAHGISMGAATVMMAQSMPQIAGKLSAFVADCGFVSPEQEFRHQFKAMHLPTYPLIWIANILTKCICGFFFGEASASDALEKATVPALFIHGEDDDFVPTISSHINYEKCASSKTLFLVPKARHADAYLVDKMGYEKHLDKLYARL